MLKTTFQINKYKQRIASNNLPEDYHEEYQYIHLLNDIIEHGKMEKGRNGNTLSIYGACLHFSLENNVMPILTTKKTAWKTCLKELLWFIKGDTSNKRLNEQKVHIWDGNASKEFLESRGLGHYEDGDLGPLYGFQWRHWNAPYNGCDEDYSKKGIDQLQYIINMLKNPETRNSRRLLISAWNPEQLTDMALPPCHSFFQFNVQDNDKLSCTVFCRSQDVPLGQPFNIASYSFLTHLIAFHTGLKAHELILYGGNRHIYEPHIETIKQQLDRTPLPFPTLTIKEKKENIDDYTVDDFILHDYNFHPPIKMDMVA